MTIIESAGVKKHGALVDEEGRLEVFAATETEDRHVNQTTGKVWSVPFIVTTTVANAFVHYIKNVGSTNLHITDVRAVNTGVASTIRMRHVQGAPSNTAPVIPVSRRLGTPVVASATTLEALDGAGIGGLTDLGLLFSKFAKANDEVHLRTTSNIILPPGQACAIEAVTIGAALEGEVSIVEIEVETGARAR